MDSCNLFFCCGEAPRVSSVNVYAGAVIYQIKFSFSDDSAKNYGERGGFRRQPFMIEPGDYLSEITVSQNEQSILGIQFTTSNGKSSPIYGRSSSKGSQVASAPADSRGGIVGLIMENQVIKGYLACDASGSVSEKTLPPAKVGSAGKVDTDEYSPVMKTGFLIKVSDYLKANNRRFVILHDGFLMYYIDEQKEPPYGVNLRGKFDLTMYQIRKEDDEHKTILLTIEPRVSNTDGEKVVIPQQKRPSVLDAFSSAAEGDTCQFTCKDHAEREEWKKQIIAHSVRKR